MNSVDQPSSSTLKETLGVFDRLNDPGTPLSTDEVAESMGCPIDSAANRLEELVEQGSLETREVESRTRVWWRPGVAHPEALFRQDEHGQDDIEESKEQLRLALDAAEMGVWELDLRNEESSRRSPQHDRIFGYEEPLDEWGFERFLEHVHPADRAGVEESFETALDEGKWGFECRIVRSDGEQRWVEVHAEFFSDAGEPVRAVGVVRDVTERKEHEVDLDRYRRVVETVEDGIYVIGDDDRFTMVNEAYAEMTGYAKEELLGMPASTVAREETVERAQRLQEELVTGERDTARVEADVQTADGETFRAEATFAVLTGEGGRHERIGVVRDITDRVERERELETRVRQQQVVTDLGRRALEDPELDALFDEAVEAIADTLDNDYCKVLELLPNGEELLLRSGCGWKDGYVGEATVGTEMASQAGYTLASERPVVVDDMEAESRFTGPELLIEHDVMSGISTIIGPFHSPWGVLGTHDTVRRRFTQHDVNFVQAVANVLSNAIERARYERRLTDTIEDLKESNERLEQFAYIASHDLQEPLRMVSNYLRLIEDRYRDELDDDAEEFIDFAVNGADRMREMIDDLLTYSRIEQHSDSLEPTDTKEVVERVLESLQIQVEELDAEIDVEALPNVRGDEKLLEQLFQNLVSNALKYHDDEPPRVEIGATRRGEKWLFRVEDNGIGIEPRYTDRIFEVFKRLHTHEEYPGTGIGLTLCKRIVDRHGGEIWVESEPGEGATFYFTLSPAGGDE
jgi:PAS domain S-box-containing protein